MATKTQTTSKPEAIQTLSFLSQLTELATPVTDITKPVMGREHIEHSRWAQFRRGT